MLLFHVLMFIIIIYRVSSAIIVICNERRGHSGRNNNLVEKFCLFFTEKGSKATVKSFIICRYSSSNRTPIRSELKFVSHLWFLRSIIFASKTEHFQSAVVSIATYIDLIMHHTCTMHMKFSQLLIWLLLLHSAMSHVRMKPKHARSMRSRVQQKVIDRSYDSIYSSAKYVGRCRTHTNLSLTVQENILNLII